MRETPSVDPQRARHSGPTARLPSWSLPFVADRLPRGVRNAFPSEPEVPQQFPPLASLSKPVMHRYRHYRNSNMGGQQLRYGTEQPADAAVFLDGHYTLAAP